MRRCSTSRDELLLQLTELVYIVVRDHIFDHLCYCNDNANVLQLVEDRSANGLNDSIQLNFKHEVSE